MKMPEIKTEADIPPVSAEESKRQARAIAGSAVVEEDVDDTMDSLSDAERRLGYGKWTVSGLYGTAAHPMEVGGEYGGLKGYQSEKSPYGGVSGFLDASSVAPKTDFDADGNVIQVPAAVPQIPEG